MSDEIQSEFPTIGIHRTPQQFAQEALSVGRPAEVNAFFPSCINGVFDEIISSSHQSLAQDRTAELGRWAMLAEEIEQKELKLKSGSSSGDKEVIKGFTRRIWSTFSDSN